MKKRGLGLLRIVLPVAILAWLFYDVHRQDPDAIPRLLTRPKNTWLLGASLGCLLIATCLSFIRWFMLVRALDIPFTLRAAFRLGFLGYLLNFVGPGAVGGDVFKAYVVARNQRSRRAEAVATILLDRIVGLYSLLVVASVAISLPASFAMPKLAQFLQIVQWLTIGGAVVIVILMLPAKFSHWLVDPLLRVPILGAVVARVTIALELYRQRRVWLGLIAILSVTVHILVAVSIHLADRAVFPVTPSFAEHMVITPLAVAAGGLPVPGGVGTFEFAMNYLYPQLPNDCLEPGQGLGVALCFRLMTITIAGIGAVYYLLNRHDVSEAVTEIESEQEQPTAQ